MSPFSINLSKTGLFVGLALLSAPNIHAATAFNSSANLVYTIQSITNTTNPGSLAGLSIEGYFEPATPGFDPDTITTGDGSVTANNPISGPTSISLTPSSSYSHGFTVSGAASEGSVQTAHSGWFYLNLSNSGTDVYDINIALDYALSAATSNSDVNTTVLLNYYTANNADVTTEVFISASNAGGASANNNGSSGLFNFQLGAGQSNSFQGDVTITGNIEATAVPIPAAFWLFLSSFSSLFAVVNLKRIRA